jgi:chemotaxis response regulator CheB
MKIFIANDSTVLTALMRAIVETEAGYQIVGTASDGMQAVDQMEYFRPDLILMDIHMPRMNGVEAVRAIIQRYPKIRILITSATINRNMKLIFDALKYGAIDYIKSPSLSAPPGTRIDKQSLRKAGKKLLNKIKTVTTVNQKKNALVYQSDHVAQVCHSKKKHIDIKQPVFNGIRPMLGIGCSTGGPTTLVLLLCSMPRPLPGPVLVCQHIDPGFDESFANWLSGETGYKVIIPNHQTQALPNCIYVAKAGKNMLVSGQRIYFEQPPSSQIYIPNIDRMFMSMAKNNGKNVCGIVLTGMGDDGAQGAKSILDHGGTVFIQNNETAIVESMPNRARSLTGIYMGYSPEVLGQKSAEWMKTKAGK